MNDNDTVYSGDFWFGKFHGKGKYFENGSIYVGEWKHGKKEGKGRKVWADGTVYEGDWKDNKKDGNGKQTWPRGSVYEGDWKDDNRNGKGKMKWVDGSSYEGDWKDDKKNGKGKKTWPRGSVYEGDWKDDNRDGKGKMKWVDGSSYVGYWKDDKKNGKGKKTWPRGSVYEGDWKDDNRDGEGKMKWVDGSSYEGDWKDDKKNGKGKKTWPRGSVYEGDWKDDNRDGKGKMKWVDGSSYEGDWKNDMKEDNGIEFAQYGEFEGEYYAGLKDGQGALVATYDKKKDMSHKKDANANKIAYAAAKDCPYCNGRGYTVKNTEVPGYGLSKTKKKCEVCGEYVWSNTAHQHVGCKHCNKTGTVPSNSSGSKGLSSYGNAGTAQDRLNAIAQDNPRAYATAMSIKYGYPMTDAEYEEYRRLPSDAAAKYMKLRNILEEGLIHFNQSMAMMYYRTDSPERVNNYMNQIITNVKNCSPEINGRISQTLFNHLENLRKMLAKSGEDYYNTTVYFHQMNNLQNNIDNYLLRMNSF